MIVVDAHEDIAYNALAFGRDYRRGALGIRVQEAGTDVPSRNGTATVGLPDALLGRVALTFATLFVAPRTQKTAPWDVLSYSDAQEACELASREMDYYERLADEHEKINLVRTQTDLDALLATWESGKEIHDHQMGLVVLMENADPIVEPRQFEEWYERGVRIVGPAWQATRYCGGTGAPGPLTDLGRELLDVLADFNVLLDLSHMAEASFLEAVDRYSGVLIASHSNPRRFRDSDRHLSDDMIRRLAERDGVMGIVLYNAFLANDWDRRMRLPFEVIPDAIDYVCQITGSAAHVGIGSDFDGGFGRESIPEGLDTVGDLLRIADALRERGYEEADIEAVMGGNMIRKLRETLPED
ncbi:MAG: dipeptidase [Anaerolineae bacterium]|nr:dipeptidase [Anaerolineae bacterium]